MARRWSKVLIAFALIMINASVLAQDAPDEATVPGELQVRMNTEYARLSVDGDEWAQHEFSGDGKTIYIKELDRTREHTIKLVPAVGGLAELEFTVAPADYKRMRMKDKTYHFVAKRTVKFEKTPAEAPPAPAPEPERGSEPEE